MIGVKARASELAIAAEFFELFKTPWEAASPGRRYEAVLCTDGDVDGLDAAVVLAFGADPLSIDLQDGWQPRPAAGAGVTLDETELPIYGRALAFPGAPTARLTTDGAPVEYARLRGSVTLRRVGYDLFAEVRHLLTVGQPASRASSPTLDMHVDLVRRLLVESGVAVVEIPPRPGGYDFTCCLTHDIDFYGIRRHGLDRTMAGFLVRSTVGSVVDWARSRRTFAEALRNLAAAASLPLVLAGLKRDFWRPFDDYALVEDPNRSTYFLVPFKGRPGASPAGPVDPTRAVAYQASEIADDVAVARARGSEIGLHGIDAWCEADAGRSELREITALTNRQQAGVRMHWLYFSEQSPRLLEQAGFDYDSTWGYNEAVGYRAGTSQVFAFPGTTRLLELPLSIMDTALFAWDRLALGRDAAWQHCDAVFRHAKRAGGTIVINWHCRSLAPERLWRSFYQALLRRLSDDARTWFATAAQAVEWFRWRRSVRFEQVSQGGLARVRVVAWSPAPIGGTVRVTLPGSGGVDERPFDGTEVVTVDLPRHSGAAVAAIVQPRLM